MRGICSTKKEMKALRWIVLGLCGLLLTACRTTRTRQTERWEQQLTATTRARLRTQRLPVSAATMRIPLPEAGTETERWTQSSDLRTDLRVRLLHDTLYIEATCDSLQTLLYEYEQQLQTQQQGAASERRSADWRPPPWFWAALLLSVGAFSLRRKYP